MKSPVKVTARMDHSSGQVQFGLSWPCLDKFGQPNEERLGFFINTNVTVYDALQGLAQAMQDELNVMVDPAPVEWLPKPAELADQTAEVPAVTVPEGSPT